MHDTRADAPYVTRSGSANRRLFGLHEKFLVATASLLALFFCRTIRSLPTSCTRVVREQVVRQACDTHQIRIDASYTRVWARWTVRSTPLRGDERHDAALAYRVKAFQEEVVVDAFGAERLPKDWLP